MARPTEQLARMSIWRHRGRRVVTGFNVVVSIALAAMVLAMVNYLSLRYCARWNVGRSDYYRLSERSLSLVGALSDPVDVVAFFQRSHDLHDDVRNLLKEYEYAAAAVRPARLRIELVDPDRDLSRTRELAKVYGVDALNVVAFRCAGRTKIVAAKDLAEYQYVVAAGSSVHKSKSGFTGEQAFSSAIQSVAESARPVVYFLTGHGERAVDDHTKSRGFSEFAGALRRDNVEVKSLLLAEAGGVPPDASVVVVAGPERAMSQAELTMLSAYASRSGRLLLLLEGDQDAGLREMLSPWGVRVGNDTVVGLSLTGRDLLVKDYGDHPITQPLKALTAMFFGPRSVEAAEGAGPVTETTQDRPRVTDLALSTAEGWAETDPTQRPARFNAGVDRAGPVSIAAAVEKGAASEIDVQIKPTRLVVVGDCDFASNGALVSGVGGNLDFAMACVNWLAEREALVAILPRVPGELSLQLTPQRLRAVHIAALGGLPLTVCLAGLLVRMARRR